MSRRSLIAITLLTIFAASSAFADFNAKFWRFYKEIHPESSASSRYAEVNLDREVVCHSEKNLDDLRILDSAGREVPYKLLEDKGDEKQSEYTARVLNKSEVKGKYSTFTLDLAGSNSVTNWLQIETPSRNFTRRVEVEGSQDGKTWATLRDDAYIFDFSRDYKSSSTKVNFPDSTYRFIRAKIWNLGELPIDVTWVKLGWKEKSPLKEMLLFSGNGETNQNENLESTDIVLDLHCRSISGGRIVIDSSDTDFNREVELLAGSDSWHWTPISTSTIFKYDTPKFRGNKDVLDLPAAECRYLLIRIFNHDDQPIRIDNIKVFTYQQRLFFAFKPGETYRLYYGNHYAKSPTYDIEETYKYVDLSGTPKLSLGPQLRNPGLAVEEKPWTERNPWILWAILIIAVTALGAFSIRLAMQMKSNPLGQ